MIKEKAYAHRRPVSMKGQSHYLTGFTLIELMVTIGIMVIINGVIFFNYPKVMANLALRRTADEIALTARQAQAYAMAAKSEGGELPGFGVHFEKDATSIVLFKDLSPADNTYSGFTEDVQIFDIQTKDKISNLSCTGSGSRSCVNLVDVVYSRQSPTSDINKNIAGSSWDSVIIEIMAHRDSDMKKNITINKNGYISVQ